ncbi:retrovirus-related pol polyprotein from transposon TNT 1-94 [Tanacetum coccineum]
MKKKYCLVVTDDYSRFTWVFFLATKDETCGILKYFISGIENLIAHKVKVIRCDNGTELKNREMNQFYEMKGILRQFSVARTPQQNGVADRRNRTLIEAVRTMLADSKLPTIFRQKQLILLAMCNIEYHLSKFDGKANEGFFVGYSLNSKAFRVFNSRTRIVEKNLHIRFSENIPNAVGSGPDWLFDIDALTRTMNYEPIVADNVNNTNNVNAASTNEVNAVGGKTSIKLPFDPNMSALEDYSIFDFSRDNEDVGAEADINNLDTTIQVSPIPTIRIHKDHPLNQVIRDFQSDTQTRRMSKNLEEHGFEEPKKVIHALKDPSSIEAIQEELLQFKLQEVWTLVDLPIGKRAIRSKWVFRNKKNERGIVIRNKARLVAQGLFLAYDSFKDFVVYQMDLKSAFICGKIEEEVHVCQPPGFEDPDFPDRVYKVEKALYRLHQAPKAWYETLSTYLLDNGFQRGKIDILLVQVYVDDIIFGSTKKELLQQKKGGIFISQDKYVVKILKKFRFIKVKTASTPIETQKPLLKDEDGEEVDVHMYRSMIGSLMYLTSLRPDIMFVVCACARYQVNPKVSHLHVVKRIFSDYAGASLDRKSTTIGCQFLGCRLISCQCKKQTVVANSITEAEYVAASSCCRQLYLILLGKAKKSVRLMMGKLFGMELRLILVTQT